MQRAFSSLKQIAVDRSDARNQAVGRRLLEQVVFAAPEALGGHGQGAIFDETVGIEKVLHIGARGALVLRAAGNRIGPVLIEGEGMALDHLGQVGADGVKVDLLLYALSRPIPRPPPETTAAHRSFTVSLSDTQIART